MDRKFSRASAQASSRRYSTTGIVSGTAAMAVFCLAAVLLGGCGDDVHDIGNGIAEMDAALLSKRTDMVAENKVVAQSLSGTNVVVSLPSVFSKRDNIEVFGTVTRRPDYNKPIDGFLDVQIRSKTGQLIDQSLIHWLPEPIPTDGTRSAKYSAKILGIPPEGSIVRVAYVQKLADLDEPLGPPENGGSGGGGGHGGGGGGRSAVGNMGGGRR